MRFILTVSLLGGLLYLVGAPYLTAYQMQQAAERRDHEALSRHIDFDSVRAHLDARLQQRIEREAGRLAGDNPLAGALGGAVGTAALRRATAAYVSPEGVAALLRGEAPDSNGPLGDIVGERMENLQLRAWYRSFDRFAITLTDPETNQRVDLILGRRGAGWQLTEVIPPGI